ncbi:MAG: hypothetical protein ACOX88_08510 [Christensenellales bacterium]|jgi:hypothetical protein
MGIVWIIVGALMEFFGLIGLIIVASGDAPPGSFATYLVLSLLGIGLIVLGVYLRRRRKIKRAIKAQTQAPQAVEQKIFQSPPYPVQAGPVSLAGHHGLLIIRWRKRWMAGDMAIPILMDDDPVELVFFSRDATVTVPVLNGTHQLSARFGFRKAETAVTVIGGRCTAVELDYSRSTGKVRFIVHGGSEPADENSIEQAIRRFEGKRALLQAALSYINQDYPVLDLTDTRAAILANKFERWLRVGIFPVFLLGILPWFIIFIMVRAMVKRTILELQPDGSITSRLARR